MASINRGLGRGIEALFNSDAPGDEAPATPLALISLDNIKTNPNQPRKTFDADKLEELADSIRAQGILQPLVVRPAKEDGHYELIAGERRLRAARMAGLGEVPVLVRTMSDHDALICTLMENLQREDLNPIEQAKGIKALQEALGCSVADLAPKLGQGRSTIFHILRLLRLDEILQEDIIANRMSISHALAISTLEPAEIRMALREYVFTNDLNSHAVEDAASYYNAQGHFPWDEQPDKPVDNVNGSTLVPAAQGDEAGASTEELPELSLYDHSTSNQPPADAPAENFNNMRPSRSHASQWPEISQLAKDIGTALNCRTRIVGTPERGNISIAYESTEQLNDLLQKMGISLDGITISPLANN